MSKQNAIANSSTKIVHYIVGTLRMKSCILSRQENSAKRYNSFLSLRETKIISPRLDNTLIDGQAIFNQKLRNADKSPNRVILPTRYIRLGCRGCCCHFAVLL